ncbi:hypothetical protein [Clostridium estertheticum]|uniref:Uncharacterized protein n=2 Tax=Clostridium estertheticum TaxID=238834 RepID=A0A1J0GEW3_9CLOT|nr:hypothetical protein [Clostridium estertheticum]APC39869.1 hypothetical protein A7L45_07190 [Clostridium estertheticum subsp. estertheticum]MBU3072650.1 hypothetical protein [Clostridium estertheticum]MBU3162743.1 hypothetical protein [Clostridium estertheticum]MBU3171963.1 hypothetical protein [Clostridium estertheticum]MBU3184955.1 hypothetical protein [Clostridium estertheticum]
MGNHIKVDKTIADTLKKLELSVSEYEHYDGKINKEPVENKTGIAVYDYRDILKTMENNLKQ